MWAQLAGAGLGLMKRHDDAVQSGKDRILAAQTQLYSPWTHMDAGPITQVDNPLTALAQGALAGGAQQQKWDKADAGAAKDAAELGKVNAEIDYINSLKKPTQQPPQASNSSLMQMPELDPRMQRQKQAPWTFMG